MQVALVHEVLGASLFETTYLPLITTLVALAGVLIALYKGKSERGVLESSAEELSVRASKTAVEVFNASVYRLQEELQEAREQIAGLEIRVKSMQEEFMVRQADAEATIAINVRRLDIALQERDALREEIDKLKGQ